MSLIKFMTICDDDLSLVSFDRLKILDISVYPLMYFCDNMPFYDTLNTDVEKFYVHINNGSDITEPSISPNIFEYEFNKAYINGYHGIVVVFPHCKWTSYRKSAETAKKRFLRKISIDEQGFEIKFINSRTFGADVLLQTIQLAELYGHFHYTVAEFLSFVKFLDKKRVSFILSYGKNKLSSKNDYAAYIIRENRLFELDICKYPEFVQHLPSNFEVLHSAAKEPLPAWKNLQSAFEKQTIRPVSNRHP